MRIKVAPAVSIAAPAAVVPPSSTEQSQPAGTALVDHTFGAWSDDDSRIAYFAPELVGDTGSMTVSDGGSDDSAGPWSFTGDADGNNGALLLHAFDSDDNYLGTAVHGFERESGGLGIQNIASRDYKNTDALDISAAGLHSLAKGSTPYATIEVSKNGAIVVSASAGTAGLTFAHTSGISGSWNIAEDITAERDQPPFHRVAMDGIAVCAADCVDAAYPVCQADDGYCTEACTTDDDCTGAFRCQLDGSPPFCQQPPTGLGTACEVAEDCEGLEADYCDSFFTGECLVSGCNLENDDCFVGLSCCDLSVFGLDEPICVEEGTCPF